MIYCVCYRKLDGFILCKQCCKYWTTVTLTTMEYGDLCPVMSIGRVVSMLSSYCS